MKPAIAKICLNLQWWLIVVLLFFSTVAFGGVHEPTLFVVRLLIVLSLFLQGVLLLSQDDYLRDFHPAIFIPLSLFILFLVLVLVQYLYGVRLFQGSGIGSANPHSTYNMLIQLVLYFLFFLVCVKVISKREFAERLSSFVAVFAFAITILGVAQRLVTNDRILWQRFLPTDWVFFGPFVNENHFGGFLGLTFPLALGLLDYRFHQLRRESRESGEKKSSMKMALAFLNRGGGFLFFLSIVTLAASFFSLARTSAIVLLFCCLYYFASLRHRYPARTYFILFLVLVASFLLLQWMGSMMIFQNFSPDKFQKALGMRFRVFGQALSLVQEYPFFGTGLGTFRFISSKAISYLINEATWDHAHNDYLELLTESGFIGFGLFASAVLSLLFLSFRQAKKNPSYLRQSLSRQAVLALFSIGMMEFFDFHLKIPALALFFTLQLAFLFQSSFGVPNEMSSSLLPLPLEGGEGKGEEVEFPELKLKQVGVKGMLFFVSLVIVVFLFRFSVIDFKAYQLSQSKQYRLLNLERAVELQPLNADLWYQLGNEYERRSRELKGNQNRIAEKQKAISAVRKAAALSPSYAYYWHYLGALEYEAGDKEEGILSLEKAVDWAPARLKHALYLLAIYLRESERSKTPESKSEYIQKAQLLYQKLQQLEVVPTEGHYQRWMGDRYYHELQKLIPSWTGTTTSQMR